MTSIMCKIVFIKFVMHIPETLSIDVAQSINQSIVGSIHQSIFIK